MPGTCCASWTRTWRGVENAPQGVDALDIRIAIAGKGGVGKTTLSAALARSLARGGHRVLAVDADPNNCLARALGFAEAVLADLRPLSEMRELLAGRAGVAEGGGFFALAPPVEDLLERFQVRHDGVSLLVMGTIDEPGGGCVCPESAVLKALVRHLVSIPDLSLVMDMEAGLEHLGRGTAQYLGALLIVVEPTPASARTAERIARLAAGLQLRLPGIVLNKVSSPKDEQRVRPHLPDLPVIASLPQDAAVADSETAPAAGVFVEAVEALRQRLESESG
jgi:CO dehydrogenase maturation factor